MPPQILLAQEGLGGGLPGGGSAGHALNPGSARGVGTKDQGRVCVFPGVVIVYHQLLDVPILENLKKHPAIRDNSLLLPISIIGSLTSERMIESAYHTH